MVKVPMKEVDMVCPPLLDKVVVMEFKQVSMVTLLHKLLDLMDTVVKFPFLAEETLGMVDNWKPMDKLLMEMSL